MSLETGIGGVNVLAMSQDGCTLRAETSNQEAHGNAVVAKAVQLAAGERSSAGDDHAIVEFLHIPAHGAQIGHDRANAVALLHP